MTLQGWTAVLGLGVPAPGFEPLWVDPTRFETLHPNNIAISCIFDNSFKIITTSLLFYMMKPFLFPFLVYITAPHKIPDTSNGEENSEKRR